MAWSIVSQLLQQHLKQVDRINQGVEHRAGKLEPSHSQIVQQILAAMRQLCDRVQAKHCRQTLQRMGGAEDSIHQMRLALGAFGFLEQEQIAAQGVDNFGRFRDELVQSLGRHVTRLSNSAATALPAQDS